MKRKRIKKILFISILGLGIIITFSFACFKQSQKNCKSIEIIIKQQNNNLFITKDDIKQIIDNQYIDELIGHPIKKINIEYLEEIIEKSSYVSDVEVYTDIKGKLAIEITQRIPIIRVINNTGVSYYIDKNGFRMPLCDKFTARVMVANGNIYNKSHNEDIIATSLIKQLYVLAKYIDEDIFWKSQIEQIYVNEEKEFELVPRIGSHIILIGDTSNLENKFEKLMLFYQKCLNEIGWNKYRVINVKYNDQIIGQKFY